MTTDTNEVSNTPRTDDQFVDANKMVPVVKESLTTQIDTPRTDACPHCGAEAFELPVEGYTCGTEPWYDEVVGSCLVRSNICYSNENTQLLSELAASLAEVERLKGALIECLEITSIYDSNGDYETARDNVYDIAANALKTQYNK
jgi:hypothetical protein